MIIDKNKEGAWRIADIIKGIGIRKYIIFILKKTQ